MTNTATSNIGLDRSGKKYICPQCGQKRFVRMKNYETGELLADEIGRCDREDNCGYHLTIKQYSINAGEGYKPALKNYKNIESNISTPVEYLPFEIMNKSVLKHHSCNLYPFLSKLFRKDIASRLCYDYCVGANKDGDTVFFQVDINGNIRQAKVMEYNTENGKRNKDKGADFAGKKILNNYNANLSQCLFGEFLLSYSQNDQKPIALFESEKTAMIASVYFPEFVCLATGGKHGAKWTEKNVCRVFANRKVILYPDLGAYENWKSKSLLLAVVAGCKVSVSNTLEAYATDEEKSQGLDLADFLLKMQDKSGLALTDDPYPVMWDYKPMTN